MLNDISIDISIMAEEALINYLESPNFKAVSTNAIRLVNKLKTAVQTKELYETHQILRTINFRFIVSREKVLALEDLLYHGSLFLLEHGEYASGQDIGVLFLEAASRGLQYQREDGRHEDKLNLANPSLTHHVNHKTMDWVVSQKASHIVVRLPNSDIGRTKFMADILRVLNPKLLNRNILHDVLASMLREHKDFNNSRYHYLHCASPENAQDVARLMIEYSQATSNTEPDVLIAQFILQFLCIQSPIDQSKPTHLTNTSTSTQSSRVNRKTRTLIMFTAEIILTEYTVKHPLISRVYPYLSPLLNYIYFIIKMLEEEKEANTYTILKQTYRVAWARNPSFEGYLNRVGTLYFGIIDPAKRQGGIFNNILMSLLEGEGDEEEEALSPQPTFSCDDLD